MCFSNLPIEFDDTGDPYLAEEADDVDRVADCDCGTAVGIDEDDPDAVFEAVLSSVPASVRDEIGERDGGLSATDTVDPAEHRPDDPAEGD